MKKPARPKRPVKKPAPPPKHVMHAPHQRAHQHQHQHKGGKAKVKGTGHAGGAGHARAHKPKAPHHKKRGLAVTDGVACCAALALAMSARLAGHQVSDEDVLDLYWRTASDPDAGASIWATLRAAQGFGLAGFRPSFREVVMPHVPGLYDDRPGRHASRAAGLIIGVTLPGGPHTLVLDASGAVWSWGELHNPAQLLPGPIEEAWLVTW